MLPVDEFDQTSTDTSLGWGKEVFNCSDLDLIFKVTLALCGGYLISIEY